MLDGAARRIRREQEQKAWLAWHVAALGRQDKLPPLKSLMPGRPRKAKAPGPDAWKSQFAAFSAWAKSFRKDKHE